jgi:L-rhamnose isomerase
MIIRRNELAAIVNLIAARVNVPRDERKALVKAMLDPSNTVVSVGGFTRRMDTLEEICCPLTLSGTYDRYMEADGYVTPIWFEFFWRKFDAYFNAEPLLKVIG